MVNFFLVCALAVSVFGVPLKGSFLLLTVAALLYMTSATGIGLLMSAFVRSQIAVIFATSIATIIPSNRFSGMIDPVSSLEGRRALRRRGFSGHAFRDHLPRRLFQSTRFRRP